MAEFIAPKALISIIIPVYNEKENIQEALKNMARTVKTPHEALVVYDFDKDNTVPVVKKFQNKYKNIRLIKNNLESGVINAIKSGLRESKTDTIVIMTSDRADDPGIIDKMWEKILGGYDIVCATRYSKGGKRLEQNSLKSFISRIVGISTPLILGIQTSDLTNGFKMYRKKVLNEIPIQSNGGWEFTMELVLKSHKKGYKITEVPAISRARIYGSSQFDFFHWLPKYLYWYVWGIYNRLQSIFGS